MAVEDNDDGDSDGVGVVPTSSSRVKSVTALIAFRGCIRCRFPTASEVPALARSDIQVTLEEGSLMRPDKAGGALQVVGGFGW